ncbi:MAG: hypothetical protein ACLGI9_08895 [Thermoanaerobaculia bacterium]
MPSSLTRRAKTLSLILGFLFGVVGAVWSLVVVDRQGDEMKRLSDTRAELARQVESLNAIASEYFIANQQGDLIFMLAQQGSARADLGSLIYQGNLLDRATPVRNMIGALAMAKQLDYRKAYDAYAKLNVEARANLSWENFVKLKETERAVITAGQERVPLLLNGMFELERQINANGAAQRRNRLIGLVSAVFGNLLLLLANLIAERD